MRLASAWSSARQTSLALAEVERQLELLLDAAEVSLVVFFTTDHHTSAALPTQLAQRFPAAVIIGTSSRSVLGSGQELEDSPGLTVLAGALPAVRCFPFQIDQDMLRSPEDWLSALGGPHQQPRGVLLLADPYSFDLGSALPQLIAAAPGVPLFGGQASSSGAPTTLFLRDRRYSRGAVGLVFEGDLEIDTLVSQGCRPIGHPMIITAVHGQRILALDGKSPKAALRDVFRSLAPADQRLFREALYIGLQAPQAHEHADPLIRTIHGIDAEGALIVGDRPAPFQSVQLHLQDVQSAHDSFAALLRPDLPTPPAGALLFSANGRGQKLFGEAHHDSSALRERHPGLPVAGMFASGELGSLGGVPTLFGYSSVVVMFRPAATAPAAPQTP